MPLPKDQSAMWNHSVSTNMLPSKEKPKSRCGNTDISCLLDLDQIATRKKPGDLGRKQRLQNQQFALAKAPNPRTSLCNLKSNVCRYSNNTHLSGTRKSIKLTTRTKPKIATISTQRKTNRRPKCKPTGAANGACAVKTWWLDLSPDDLDSGNELVGMSATSTPKSSAAQKILVSFPKQRCKGNKCKPKVEYKWFNLDLGNEFGPTKAQTRKPLLRQEQAQDSPAMSISSGFDEDNDRVVEITSRNSEPALARVSRLVRVPRLHSSIDSGLYSTTGSPGFASFVCTCKATSGTSFKRGGRDITPNFNRN